MSLRGISAILLVTAFVSACQKEELEEVKENDSTPLPFYFPVIEQPEDNEYTKERWQLGKKLFFDPIMSVDESVSCASCHKPEFAFSDNRAISPGTHDRLGERNAPSLANVAYHPYFTREGGVPTLEMQVLIPIQEHVEFDFNIVDLAERLKNISEYTTMSEVAYGREPDPFVITRSIACFERSLISADSKYDRFLQGQVELSEHEMAGMILFFSDRLNCSSCHGGFDLTDYSFENNGLFENYKDPGRYRLTKSINDLHLFKVPSLRNVAVTSPYMHDGSFPDLASVVGHYASGGQNHAQKGERMKNPKLNQAEQLQLIAFLKTLTDESFITNSIYHE